MRPLPKPTRSPKKKRRRNNGTETVTARWSGMTATHPPSFNPADRGTSEDTWQRFFGDAPTWRPSTRDIVVLAPHPDDEILGCGGLMSHCAAGAQDVVIVSVTDGEAAYEADSLGSVRCNELLRALRELSPGKIAIERLHIPDGSVAREADRLESAISRRLSNSCTLIAPFEHDGHPDHDAVGRMAIQIGLRRGVTVARYPIWAWHHSEPREFRGYRWGIFPLSASAQDAKRRALQCFESQLRPRLAVPILPPHVLAHFERGYEAFLL